ncbi:UPF0545 protein C22orf39 homolog [Chrysoperla carnea]|uniref:UPF0545 protein C22orf39 homolog n=1 Tax=Chrysoperla carnea TaxID=189513 RepID=UPI001D0806E5|nr:UPF0545 protein C22orf39 homolog [Chrysoperla carnea]
MSEKDLDKRLEEDEWMIRPCHVYKEEYSDCKSIKARFHQYFIFGDTIDCSQWKNDYNNCSDWVDRKDKKAAVKLIESESARRKARLDAHDNNTVWEKRKEPPSDWARPLPEWMEKEHSVSYLGIKSKELAEGKASPNDQFQNRTLCVIM